jgi:hypothetical protein
MDVGIKSRIFSIKGIGIGVLNIKELTDNLSVISQ